MTERVPKASAGESVRRKAGPPASDGPPPSGSWIAFDTEATGLEPGSRIIELAAIAFDDEGKVLGQFDRLIDPGIPLSPEARAVHGIDEAELDGAADTRTVLAEFRDWLPRRGRLVAHNARFDVDILGWECERVRRAKPKLRVVDSLPLARRLGLPSGRLEAIVEHYGWRTPGEAHRALPDADATRQLLLEARRELPTEVFAECCAGIPFANAWHFPRKLPEGCELLATATADRRPLRVAYTDARGTESDRVVTPYGYARTRQGIRFHGWCHLREGRRNFALERARLLAFAD